LLCLPHLGKVTYFAGKGVAKIPRSYPNFQPKRQAIFQPNSHRSILMSALKTAFDKAMADSKNLSERPDNATLLKIYALYKQGSTGDNEEKKPGFGDMVARAKWDAWAKLKGTSTDDAMQQYVDLIAELG
jgi:acyl-CoA-binding protein